MRNQTALATTLWGDAIVRTHWATRIVFSWLLASSWTVLAIGSAALSARQSRCGSSMIDFDRNCLDELEAAISSAQTALEYRAHQSSWAHEASHAVRLAEEILIVDELLALRRHFSYGVMIFWWPSAQGWYRCQAHKLWQEMRHRLPIRDVRTGQSIFLPQLSKSLSCQDSFDPLKQRFKMWIGRLAPKQYRADERMVVVAGARSGKLATFIALAHCEHRGSLVCIDPKGELACLDGTLMRDHVLQVRGERTVMRLGRATWIVGDAYLLRLWMCAAHAFDLSASIASAPVIEDKRNGYFREVARAHLTAMLRFFGLRRESWSFGQAHSPHDTVRALKMGLGLRRSELLRRQDDRARIGSPELRILRSSSIRASTVNERNEKNVGEKSAKELPVPARSSEVNQLVATSLPSRNRLRSSAAGHRVLSRPDDGGQRRKRDHHSRRRWNGEALPSRLRPRECAA